MTAPDHPSYPELALFIAGEWITETARAEPVEDPATGEVLGHLPWAGPAEIAHAARAAAAALPDWRATGPYGRSQILRRAALLLRERAPAIARSLTREQGKPLAEAQIEIAAACDQLEWFAEEGRRVFARVIPGRTPDLDFEIRREAIGVVAAFTPWNFPATGPMRKIAASLAAGCTCVVKPAEETPATALAIAAAFADAGLPAGALNVVFGDAPQIAEQLIASPEIRKVSLTGSTRVGRILGELAGRNVKPITLELGGHAPVLVFEDADVPRAATLAAAAKFRNAGQVCISPTRFLVQRSIFEDFVGSFQAEAERIRVGCGLDAGVGMGPLANLRRKQAVIELVDEAVAAGARLRLDGRRLHNQGTYLGPTVLTDVPTTARIMNEEPFGPVAVINPAGDEGEMIAEANRLPYGLAAYAFTRDADRLARLHDRIESGMIGLNSFAITIAETPFGGMKESGFGSEGGREGLEAYLTTKLVSRSFARSAA